jgi:hypothetical protein
MKAVLNEIPSAEAVFYGFSILFGEDLKRRFYLVVFCFLIDQTFFWIEKGYNKAITD